MSNLGRGSPKDHLYHQIGPEVLNKMFKGFPFGWYGNQNSA